MSDWEDLDREIGAHNSETGEYVVRRKQRRATRDNEGVFTGYEFRWVKVGEPA